MSSSNQQLSFEVFTCFIHSRILRKDSGKQCMNCALHFGVGCFGPLVKALTFKSAPSLSSDLVPCGHGERKEWSRKETNR